jgi:mRNA (guanine-N7-)-methyltransferase
LKLTRRKTFDVVSCQFALHYSFETEARARTAIKNISDHLVNGGHFIGTIPNSNRIVKTLRNIDGLSFGNSIYSVTFESKQHPSVFGHKYSFVLADAIDDCPEFLVHVPTFIQICKEYGLEVLIMRPFHEFFEKNCTKGLDLLERMRIFANDGSFPEEDWEVAGFTFLISGVYMAFAFRKR